MSSVCNKCRRSPPIDGDTWCVGCSAWESLGKELTSTWSGPLGVKTLANEIVLNAVREVRGLRALGAGISRAPEVARVPSAPAGRWKKN